jgi:hypothetical protein
MDMPLAIIEGHWTSILIPPQNIHEMTDTHDFWEFVKLA